MSSEKPDFEQIIRLRDEKRWVELVQVDWFLRNGPLTFLHKLLAWFEKNKDTLSPQDYSTSVSSLRNAITLRESQNAQLRLAGRLFDKVKQHQIEGRFAEAIADLTELIALDPNNADYYRERGLSRKRNGEKWPDYQDDLDRAFEIEPNDVENQLAVIDEIISNEFPGSYCFDEVTDYGLLRDVIARCNALLDGGEDDETEGRIFRRRSEAYFHLAPDDNREEYDRLMASSLADIDRAIELDPQCAEYYLARERVLSSLRKKPDRADLISCLSKAIECDPSCWEAYKWRCQHRLDDFNLTAAHEDVEKASELCAKAGRRSIRLGESGVVDSMAQESLERLRNDIMRAAIEQLKSGNAHQAVLKVQQAETTGTSPGVQQTAVERQSDGSVLPSTSSPPLLRLEEAPFITSGLSVEMPHWTFLGDFGLKHLLGSKDSAYYEQKGHSHYVQKQYAEANECYSMAIQRAGGTWHQFLYYQHRARARMAQARFQEALADFSEAIRLDSSGFMAAKHMPERIRGDIEAMQGRYEEAVRYYSASLDMLLFASDEQRKRDKAEGLNNRGIALLALSRPKKSLRDLSEAIEICPLYKALYMNRAYAYRLLGDAASASQDEEQAMRVEQQQPAPQKPVDVSVLGNLLGSLFALIWYWKCPNCGQRSGKKVGTDHLGDSEQRVETRYDLHSEQFKQMWVNVWTVRLYFQCKECQHQWTELEVRSAIA